MKVLITGAGGYLGKGLVLPFEQAHTLRLLDVRPFESRHEVVAADLADLAVARSAVEGMDAIVIAHMASRQAGAYETPELAFDANVKGTANLFHAAVEKGIKRICLISSTGVLEGYKDNPPKFYTRDIAPRSCDIYGLTKVLQEHIAEQYHRVHKLAVSVLRIGWVMDADTWVDKYGRQQREYIVGYADRRDIGSAARLALERVDSGYEVFYVESTSESADRMDIAYTKSRLGWSPAHNFRVTPEGAKIAK